MSYLVIPAFFLTFGEEYADKQYFQPYCYIDKKGPVNPMH
jgi:hypothetical protein